MLTPKHKVGAHWIPVHQRPEDERYFQALQPGGIKIVNPDPEQVRRCLSYIHPNGVVVLRDHPLSEQKEDMALDPTGTGIRHAQEWAAKLTSGRFAEFSGDPRIVVCGINEPYIRTLEEEKKVVQYSKSLLNTSTDLGLRVLAGNISVGWPRNLGKDMPPFWDSFLELEEPILRNRGFWGAHEYYYSNPEESWFDGGQLGKWGWLCYRINSCPLKVPIIIGEWGMEKMVDIERWKNEGRPPKGWVGNISAKQYAEYLWKYAEQVNPNVFCIMPFTTDWGSHDWETQDTKEAHTEILLQRRSAIWSDPYPSIGDIIPPIPENNYKLCWPKMARITQYFGGSHSGLDIGVPLETPIFSLYSGVVAWVDTDLTGYGNYIRIHHPELGFDSFYAHLSTQKVTRGQTVVTGQLIGTSGSTGNSTGPHLHLEIRLRSEEGYRLGISSFSKGQVDPIAVKYALGQIHSFEEK